MGGLGWEACGLIVGNKAVLKQFVPNLQNELNGTAMAKMIRASVTSTCMLMQTKWKAKHRPNPQNSLSPHTCFDSTRQNNHCSLNCIRDWHHVSCPGRTASQGHYCIKASHPRTLYKLHHHAATQHFLVLLLVNSVGKSAMA